MKYLKLFENYNEDNIYMIDSEYQLLKTMLKSSLDVIGFGMETSELPFTNHRLKLHKTDTNVYRIMVKLDFRSIEYSILWFICKACLGEEKAREGYRVMALSTKFLDPAEEISQMIHVQKTSNEYSNDADNVFKIIINKILNYFTTNISDTRICIGNSSEYEYPIFKNTIIYYFKFILNNNTSVDDSIFKTIKEYIRNNDKSHSIFNEIRNKNPFLFSKFKDEETTNSAELGSMGFED